MMVSVGSIVAGKARKQHDLAMKRYARKQLYNELRRWDLIKHEKQARDTTRTIEDGGYPICIWIWKAKAS